MVSKIFVNMPVKDLEKSRAFFGSLGFGFSGTPGVDTGFGTVGGGGTGNLAFEADPGVEWLVGGRWGFDFYIPIQFNVPLSGGNVQVLLGAAYGIVAYL